MDIITKQHHKLSTDINVITAEINAYQRVAGEAIFEIGKRLKYVKDNDLAHGEFMAWYESNGMTKDFVSKAIKVTDNLANFETSRNIGLDALYQIATMPEPARTETHTLADGTEKTPDEMTVRELREVKAALKAEQARRAEAEAQAETAQRSEEITRRQLDELTDVEPEARTEHVKVTDIETERKVRRYEELFGDVSMYDGQTTRVTNGDAITYAVFEFTQDVRQFIEKYGHLTHFASEFSAMIDEGKSEYGTAISDMRRFMTSIERAMDAGQTTIING